MRTIFYTASLIGAVSAIKMLVVPEEEDDLQNDFMLNLAVNNQDVSSTDEFNLR